MHVYILYIYYIFYIYILNCILYILYIYIYKKPPKPLPNICISKKCVLNKIK